MLLFRSNTPMNIQTSKRIVNTTHNVVIKQIRFGVIASKRAGKLENCLQALRTFKIVLLLREQPVNLSHVYLKCYRY